MLIDTHCHMNIMLRNFNSATNFSTYNFQELEGMKNILKNASLNQVTTIINVGTNLIESQACINLAEIFENCWATIGLHPNDATMSWKNDIQQFEQLLQNKDSLKIVGVGECGIDTHYPDYNLQRQTEVFHAQIQLALTYDVALVIHSRDADELTYQALAHYKNEPKLHGTIHCFSSNEIYAQKYIDLGFVLGFGGTLTYPKNHTLRAVAQNIPLEKIILETDAPFLSPQAVRGTQNNPANILLIAQFLAQLRNETFDKIAQTTSMTSKQLFGINC
jgi:TatD DNase family protein